MNLGWMSSKDFDDLKSFVYYCIANEPEDRERQTGRRVRSVKRERKDLVTDH
jgi:hypothetical protein